MASIEHSQLLPVAARAVTDNVIVVKGARMHNLRNLDVEIPKHSLVVFTGPSGSGKSSLAFDTVYSEGRRRYVESMSIYARQFLGMVEKPDVDQITGLSPAISIEQKTTGSNPRSTVGTITEVYDHLRVLYAQLGDINATGDGPKTLSQDSIVAQIAKLAEGTKFMLLAPIIQNRKGEFRDLFEQLRKSGFTRARVDGEIVELEGVEKVALRKKHDIDVVIDRLVSKPSAKERLADSVEQALTAGEGRLVLLVPAQKEQDDEETVFVRHAATRNLSHQNFSFNSPVGWCPNCRGIGSTPQIEPELLVFKTQTSVNGGAIAAIGKCPADQPKNFSVAKEVKPIWDALRSWAKEDSDRDLDASWDDLKPTVRETIIHGKKGDFEGLLTLVDKAKRKARRQAARDFFGEFYEQFTCKACDGARLNEESRAVTFRDVSLVDLQAMSISELVPFFENVELEGREAVIASELIGEVINRLKFLEGVGLGYLELGRGAGTLSGGESQRIRLASQLGSDLSGILYIMDEPSIGLHQRDNRALLDTLQALRDRGNSIIVVEHDQETMEVADWIVDFGPGAGREGGDIVAEGPLKAICDSDSITGAYLSGRKKLETPKERRPGRKGKLEILGATHHNLKDIDVTIPLGTFTCVTGVSGAGKSSLVNEIIYPAIARNVFYKHRKVGEVREIKGLEHFDKVIEIDQSPLGRTPRSNPATYTKVFDEIRKVFSQLPDSKIYGFTPGRFSFNVAGGRCEECKGAGAVKAEMNFLADVYVPCDLCHGKRFNHTTLMVTYKGRNISDVLRMTIGEAHEFFSAYPKIKRILGTLMEVGLDYVQLGQASTTLSGGEAQRVKLSRELAKVATGSTLYILDEPSTGLHFDDIRKLLNVVNKLVDAGNTVLMIEHNLDIIKAADYVLDLGPEGGESGGHLVAAGTPEDVAKVKESYTGRFLAEVL